MLQFVDGSIGTISASDAAPAPWSWEATMAENLKYFHLDENYGFFCGSRASLAIPRMELWSYPNEREDGWEDPLQRRRVKLERRDPLTAQLDNFCAVIRREEAPVVSGVDALGTLSTTLAILESARTNRPIEL
jgi:predicted dehydrogenase